MNSSQMLEVVDDNDIVIALEPRHIIHAEGLRHREVHVFLGTPSGQLVLQRRSATKDTYPNYLDASAGGHVEPGQSYLEAALMELHEETGLTPDKLSLTEIDKIDKHQVDSGVNNRVFRTVYLLPWQGQISDLTIEANDGAGFELITINELLEHTTTTAPNIVPGLLSPDYCNIFAKMKQILQSAPPCAA